jgi:thioredoxin 1
MSIRHHALKGHILFLSLAFSVLLAVGGLANPARAEEKALPRLVDLGAKKCIPCKMMAPILDELAKEYAGKMEVIFIDVWEHPEKGREYGIRLIPTQIFFAPSGEELFRHAGFYSKKEILNKWEELGYSFEDKK